MLYRTKAFLLAIALFALLSLVLVCTAVAAGSIVLNPTAAAPSSSVSVSGTSFAATSPVVIGFGAESAAYQTNMAYSGTGVGPYSGTVSVIPIKPGSFVLTADTTIGGGIVSTYSDNGDGTLSGSFEGAVGTVNYATGQWSRTSTVDLTDYEQV